MSIHGTTIQRMRLIVAATLTGRALIERETASTGQFGEATHAWQVVGVDVPCRIITVGNQATSQTVLSGGREVLTEQYTLVVGFDVTLAVDYRVTVNGVRYLVVQLVDDLTDKVMQTAVVVRDNG